MQTSVNSYFTSIMDYAASFQVSQFILKVTDSSLDVVDGALNKIGSDEKGTVRSGVRKVHSTANTIRISAVKKVGTEKAKMMEDMVALGIPAVALEAAVDLGSDTAAGVRRSPRCSGRFEVAILPVVKFHLESVLGRHGRM